MWRSREPHLQANGWMDGWIAMLPSCVKKPLPVVLIVLVAAGETNGLRPDTRLARDASDVRQVSTPLPAVHAIGPALTDENALAPLRIVRRRDGAEVIGRHGDENLATGGIGFASLDGPLAGEAPVGPLLVLDVMVGLGRPRGSFHGRCRRRVGRQRCQSDRHDQRGVDSRVVSHRRGDESSAVRALVVSPGHHLLETLQARIVSAWRLHTCNGAWQR